VHYAVTGLGAWDNENSKSAFADNDQRREIAAASLEIPNNPDWKDFAISALASAAFPVGLAPRLIGAALGTDSKPGEYHDRRLPIDGPELSMSPNWLPAVRAENPFWFVTADGGIIDNDPFEYARFTERSRLANLSSTLDKVDRAVIMVSPSPS
jgi:hypothetical protein